MHVRLSLSLIDVRIFKMEDEEVDNVVFCGR